MNKINKALKVLIILLILAIAMTLGLIQLNKPLDRNDTTMISVSVPEGSSTGDIAQILVDEGVVKSVTNFKIISKLFKHDGKYLAGRYSVSPGMSVNDICKTLVAGSNDLLSFTIPEGYTIEKTAQKLSDDGVVDYANFMQLVQNGDFSEFSFLKGAQKGKNHLEGFLFPNTYSIDADANEEQIITAMLSQFDTVFTDEYKARAKELGYSEYEIIIIASLIEREAQVDEDRGKVASVIYNRLDEGMKLQFCSTVQYVLGSDAVILSNSDIEVDSPYNTYKNKGLPPGPICSPGEASIKAALYPDESDYLYFVVSDKLDGSNNFSSNEEQFNRDREAFAKAYEKQQEAEGSDN